MKTNTSSAYKTPLRYCREKKGYCENANWQGECSITACNKERLYRIAYGNTTKQMIIREVRNE